MGSALAMSIVVQEARLDLDRGLIVDALHRFLTPYLTPESNATRFAWLYQANPYGAPRVWTARRSDGGQVIGVASAFPRRLYVREVAEQGWVLGDFCIHPDYRTLGPAVRLQRVFLEEAEAGRIAFWYDFPNPGMVAVYRRMGLAPTHEVIRFARPLRLDPKFTAIVRSRRLGALLAAPANWLLRVGGTRTPARGKLEIETLHGACGPEFTGLSREIRGRLGLSSERSAEYLNWRFHGDPLHHYEFLTARHHGSLRGYAVFRLAGSEAHIVDLFGADGAALMGSLIGAVIARLRESDVATLSLPLLSTHPWAPVLRRLGFHPRESGPVITGGSYSSAALTHTAEGGPWLLLDGDRDS